MIRNNSKIMLALAVALIGALLVWSLYRWSNEPEGPSVRTYVVKNIDDVLNKEEQKHFCLWEPGHNVEKDSEMADLMVRKGVTGKIFNDHGKGWKVPVTVGIGTVLEMPDSFSTTRKNKLRWHAMGRPIDLIETRVSSLVFEGTRNDRHTFVILTITLASMGDYHFANLDSFKALKESKVGSSETIKGLNRNPAGVMYGTLEECTFFRIPKNVGFFCCPDVLTWKFSELEAPHVVEVTLVADVVTEVTIKDKERPYSDAPPPRFEPRVFKSDLPVPRKKLEWKHPNPIGPDDVFGPGK